MDMVLAEREEIAFWRVITVKKRVSPTRLVKVSNLLFPYLSEHCFLVRAGLPAGTGHSSASLAATCPQCGWGEAVAS